MKEELLKNLNESRKNLIIEGDIVSGKTTNVLFPIVENMIEQKQSIFILDAKEEYINNYYQELKQNDYNIITVNLRDPYNSDGWNPIEYPYFLYQKGEKDKAQDYLEKIAHTIFYEDSKQDPYWSLTASDFFIGVTLALFEDATTDEINFNSICNVFNGVNKKIGKEDYVTKYFKQKDSLSKPYIFASSTFLAPNETKGSILSVARQKLMKYITREKVSQLMNKTTFNYEDIINKPTVIFFIARDEDKSLNGLSTMFIEQLFSVLVENKSIRRFNFILDNFDILYKCNDLIEILNAGISRNIKTYIATNSVSELVKIYGSYMARLCDYVIIKNNQLKLIINNTEKNLDKHFESVSLLHNIAEYPHLKESTIKIFDLDRIIDEIMMKKFGQPEFNKYNSSNNSDVSEMIKSIDKTIERLAREESEKESNNNQYDVNEVVKSIDEKIEQLEQEDKKANEKMVNDKNEIEEVFSAFIGGYFGPSSYYYVNKIGKKYEFGYGYSEDGHHIVNKRDNKEIRFEECNELIYNQFVEELITAMSNWKKNYNNNVMDGTQWEFNFKDKNLTYSGSNAYPENFNDVKMSLLKYFVVF